MKIVVGQSKSPNECQEEEANIRVCDTTFQRLVLIPIQITGINSF
jgi:hypothetical protein